MFRLPLRNVENVSQWFFDMPNYVMLHMNRRRNLQAIQLEE